MRFVCRPQSIFHLEPHNVTEKKLFYETCLDGAGSGEWVETKNSSLWLDVMLISDRNHWPKITTECAHCVSFPSLYKEALYFVLLHVYPLLIWFTLSCDCEVASSLSVFGLLSVQSNHTSQDPIFDINRISFCLTKPLWRWKAWPVLPIYFVVK